MVGKIRGSSYRVDSCPPVHIRYSNEFSPVRYFMHDRRSEKKKEITPAVSEKLEIKTTSPPVEVIEEEEGIPKGNSSI